MEVVVERGCGLDVHKRSLTACLLTPGEPGKPHKEIRTFGTTTHELLDLADWLTEHGCTHAAMESTGVYWKPIFNILEGLFDVMVVNAQHIKTVPGRKTDVGDAEWIADLLRHGLMRGSFIPTQQLRELRDLVRYRKTLIRTRAAEVNRLQKTLEGANIKLASVATDVTGVSGRAMLEALVQGAADAHAMAQLAKGRMRKKIPELEQALSGRVRDHHRFLLRQLLAHIDHLNEAVDQCNGEIEQRMVPFMEEIDRLCTIPGVDVKTSQLVIAEIGADMTRFPTHKHLASWAGLCPGNHESAGKRKSGKIRKGSPWLREGLVEAARAAARSKNTYLSALYRRLAARRGANKAALAVAHAILVMAYHMLRDHTTHQELGSNFFDELDRERTAKRLVKRLESIGFQVTLEDGATTAA